VPSSTLSIVSVRPTDGMITISSPPAGGTTTFTIEIKAFKLSVVFTFDGSGTNLPPYFVNALED
jgi:hypothetical protein